MQITSATLQKAVEFSVEAHKGVVRKGDGRPYILHPFSVMWRVNKAKKSSNRYLIACVALLHDTVEDNPEITIEIIAKEFGYQIAALVQELTLDKDKYKEIGKKKYIAQEMFKMSSYALAIKLCDRLDNVDDMKNMSPAFIKRYVKETKYILKVIKKRKLTDTHKKLILKIKKILSKY